MKYSIIVFDIDGTLIDTEFAVLNSLKESIYDLKGINYSPHELKFALGIPSGEALKKLGIEDDKLQEAYDLWNDNFSKYIPEIKLFSGILDLIQSLYNRGIPLALLTSKDELEMKNDFLPLGIMKYFKYTVTAESTKKHKPHPEPMLKILEMACYKPGEAVYIGDSIYDMQCANSAGVDCILALWSREGVDGIEATYYAKAPKDVWNIINS